MLYLISRFLNVKSFLCFWNIPYQVRIAVDFAILLNLDCLHFVRHIFNSNENLDVHIEFMRNRFQASYNSFLVAQILLC